MNKNCQPKRKLFEPFQFVHLVEKQAYKKKLPKNGQFMMFFTCETRHKK